jgi:spermidine synthase
MAPEQPQRVGLIGLGVGTLATYGRSGDTYRIYELNPEVLDVARRRFSYLGDSRARIETPLGDARLVLEREPPQRLDVLAVDAFSSDSIPVHLITREAARLYQRHVAPGGVIAFHISNRYLALAGVVRQLADDIGWQAVRVIDDPGEKSFLYRSDWVLVTANAALVERLKQAGAGEDVEPPTGVRPWTDDYNNLFQVLK